MITYVNSKDAKLFEMAAEDLGVEPGSLDIDQYLNSLDRLKAISPKYVRLPLYEDGHEDEEIFEIDANARTIKIPASFRKNGVGVVSDELAETVWFKINRYFDIKDFGKAAGVVGEELKDGNLHILIQWEAPDGAKGASWAYAIDADTDPEYIYFGWALTAEHLTAKAGNIRFAIRIMQYDVGGDIAYSFATQAVAIAVKASLDFDLTDEGIELETVADKIASRLMGGQIAYCPVFAPESQELPEGGNLPPYILNLEVPVGAEDDVAKAKLEVVATAPEGTNYDAVAYKWYKKGANDPDFALIDPDDPGFEGQFTPALTVTSSGHYYVVVFGMIEIVDNNEFVYDSANDSVSEEKFKYHTSVASSKSVVCEIPAPERLEILEEDQIAKFVILNEDASLLLLVKRQTIGENQDVVGVIDLKFEKTAGAAKDLDLETASFSEVSGIPFTVDGGNIAIDMHEAAEGYYRITVINKLNGDQEETVCNVICRVLRPAKVDAAVAEVFDENDAAVVGKGIANKDKIVANITVENSLQDELEIKWYQVAGGHQDEEPPVEGDLSTDIWIEEASGEVYYPDDDGFFYFVAINHVEDTEFALASNVVEFTR